MSEAVACEAVDARVHGTHIEIADFDVLPLGTVLECIQDTDRDIDGASFKQGWQYKKVESPYSSAPLCMHAIPGTGAETRPRYRFTPRSYPELALVLRVVVPTGASAPEIVLLPIEDIKSLPDGTLIRCVQACNEAGMGADFSPGESYEVYWTARSSLQLYRPGTYGEAPKAYSFVNASSHLTVQRVFRIVQAGAPKEGGLVSLYDRLVSAAPEPVGRDHVSLQHQKQFQELMNQAYEEDFVIPGDWLAVVAYGLVMCYGIDPAGIKDTPAYKEYDKARTNLRNFLEREGSPAFQTLMGKQRRNDTVWRTLSDSY
jgi:hypothetical protein